MNIGIVGLGLIGGSLAKSIKCRTRHYVFGYDLQEQTIDAAKQCHAIDEILTQDNIAFCNVIFLAIPPRSIVEWVKSHADMISPSTIVIDMCGVKRVIVRELLPVAKKYGFNYIGGHPMAGREQRGFSSSVENLFDEASMILTPDENEAVPEWIQVLFHEFGFSRVIITNPESHDSVIAYTSHLGHIISNAYAKSPTIRRSNNFTAGSFRDMTRVALMDEDLWAELFLDNSDYLCKELEGLASRLREYSYALRNSDKDYLLFLLREVRKQY